MLSRIDPVIGTSHGPRLCHPPCLPGRPVKDAERLPNVALGWSPPPGTWAAGASRAGTLGFCRKGDPREPHAVPVCDPEAPATPHGSALSALNPETVSLGGVE